MEPHQWFCWFWLKNLEHIYTLPHTFHHFPSEVELNLTHPASSNIFDIKLKDLLYSGMLFITWPRQAHIVWDLCSHNTSKLCAHSLQCTYISNFLSLSQKALFFCFYFDRLCNLKQRMQTWKSFTLRFVCIKFQPTSIKSFVSHTVRLNLKSEEKLINRRDNYSCQKNPIQN